MKKSVTSQKSSLVKQAERLFRGQDVTTFVASPVETYPAYGELRIVQSVTTYSVCEDPIPNLTKQQ
jgi:hypothetical protein